MSEISLGFLGSGEFDPWSEPVERWLLARSRTPDGPVLVCATASAHEGEASYDGWANKGLEHYGSLGIAAEVLPQGILVNAVLPSIIDTPANRAAQPTADHSRWVAPAEIAKVVLFLAGDESAPTSAATAICTACC